MSHLSPETLHLYLDDQLDRSERAATAVHLASCAVCRRELAALEDLFAALATLPPAPLPLDLTPQVLRAITAPSQPWRSPLAWGALVAQLALAALLLFWQASRIGSLLSGWLMQAWASLQTLDPLALPGFPLSVDPALLDPARVWADLTVTLPAPAPVLALAPTQWALLFAVACTLWLLGNRLLLGAAATQEVAR